jgi:hypothetical protein
VQVETSSAGSVVQPWQSSVVSAGLGIKLVSAVLLLQSTVVRAGFPLRSNVGCWVPSQVRIVKDGSEASPTIEVIPTLVGNISDVTVAGSAKALNSARLPLLAPPESTQSITMAGSE